MKSRRFLVVFMREFAPNSGSVVLFVNDAKAARDFVIRNAVTLGCVDPDNIEVREYK